MTPITGSCHCRNITYTFTRPDYDPAAGDTLPVRTCTCTFCIKHGDVYTSHPQGQLIARIADETMVQRYQFGTKTARFYTCKQCGVFPFVTSEIEGNLYAVVNVNTFENVDRGALIPTPMDFEGEEVDDRLGRRTRTWISTVEIES